MMGSLHEMRNSWTVVQFFDCTRVGLTRKYRLQQDKTMCNIAQERL
jgi:hypothetical protein